MKYSAKFPDMNCYDDERENMIRGSDMLHALSVAMIPSLWRSTMKPAFAAKSVLLRWTGLHQK